MKIPTELLFWEKVDIRGGTECWPWLAGKHRGYGAFGFSGRMMPASRVAWILLFGNPGKLWVLHSCDNPSCCNPYHLFLGTPFDNSQDMVKKERQARGERSAGAKLSEECVQSIRFRKRLGEKASVLGQEFGVHPSHITRICRCVRWRHVS
jgi:hypothetical protein